MTFLSKLMQVYPCMVIIWINFGLLQNIGDTKMSILGTQLFLSGDEDDDEDDFERLPCMLRTYPETGPWSNITKIVLFYTLQTYRILAWN